MDLRKTLQRLRWAYRAVKFGPTTYYETLGGLRTAAGVSVDPVSALGLSALLAAMLRLGNALSTVPLKVWERTPEGQVEAPGHELYARVHDSANPRMTAAEWRFEQVIWMMIWGHSYTQIVMNGKNEVTQFWPLHPTRTKVVDPSAEQWIFRHTRPDGTTRDFPQDEILHIPHLVEGKSIFEHAKEVLGLSISADQFAARYFAGGGVQPHALKAPNQVAVEKKKEIVDLWHEHQRLGRIPFLDMGADVVNLQSKPAEIQLIEARRFAVEEISRITGVPPHLLAALDRATNNNIEHQGIDFVTHGVRPLAVRIEQRMNMSLLGKREGSRYFVEHNLDGLQRGDFKSRADAITTLTTAGVLKPNEGRKLLNLPAAEGGDQLYIQGAQVPIDLAGKKNNGNQDPPTQA